MKNTSTRSPRRWAVPAAILVSLGAGAFFFAKSRAPGERPATGHSTTLNARAASESPAEQAELMKKYYMSIETLNDKEMNYGRFFAELARNGWTVEKLKRLLDVVTSEWHQFIFEQRLKFGANLFCSIGFSDVLINKGANVGDRLIATMAYPVNGGITLALFLNPNALDGNAPIPSERYFRSINWLLDHERRHALHGLELGAMNVKLPEAISMEDGSAFISTALLKRQLGGANIPSQYISGKCMAELSEVHVMLTASSRQEFDYWLHDFVEFAATIPDSGIFVPPASASQKEVITFAIYLARVGVVADFYPKLAAKNGFGLSQIQEAALAKVTISLRKSLETAVKRGRLDSGIFQICSLFGQTAKSALARPES